MFWGLRLQGKGKSSLRIAASVTNLLLVLFLLLALPLWEAVHGFKLDDYATDVSIAEVLSLSNAQRMQAGSRPLAENRQLMTAAYNKAANMFAEDYWAHNSPEGATPWTFITNAGYRYAAAAENLAEDYSTSADVVTAWMNSEPHRVNLLNPRYQDVGIAVMNGTLLGEQTTLVVMEFGQPITVPVAPAATVPAPTPKAPAPALPPSTAKLAPTPVKSVVNPPVISSPPAIAAPRQSLPMRLTNNLMAMTWLKSATALLCTVILALTYLKRRPVIWRLNERLPRRTMWLRAHPMLQVNLLACAALMSAGSSLGAVR